MLAGCLWRCVCVSMVVGTNAGALDAMSLVIADLVSLVVAAVATVKKATTTATLTSSAIAATNESVGRLYILYS